MISRLFPLFAALALAGPAMAQEPQAQPRLALELNALQQSDNGCRVSFLAFNGLGETLDRAAFEVALFDRSGAIAQLVTLDFKGLTAEKTKVLQFELPQLQCTDVGRVLINDVAACEGGALAPGACLDQLETETRLDVTFGI